MANCSWAKWRVTFAPRPVSDAGSGLNSPSAGSSLSTRELGGGAVGSSEGTGSAGPQPEPQALDPPDLLIVWAGSFLLLLLRSVILLFRVRPTLCRLCVCLRGPLFVFLLCPLPLDLRLGHRGRGRIGGLPVGGHRGGCRRRLGRILGLSRLQRMYGDGGDDRQGCCSK
jgi:hypothetical protein